jgi:histone H3/H4
MESDDDQEAARAAQLEVSLQHFIAKIVKHTAPDWQVSSGYLSALTGVVYQFTAKCMGRDLIAFRDHAGRRNVTEEDVLLVARKTPFHDHLRQYLANDLGYVPKGTPPAKPTRTKKSGLGGFFT